MTFSVQYKVKSLGLWFEFVTAKDAKEAAKLERELKATFKTRIVKE